MYGEDPVIVAEHREVLQGAVEEWRETLWPNMNLAKTEVMWVGKGDRGVKHQAGSERY